VAPIQSNRLVALVAVYRWGQLAFGAQAHLIRTSYGDPAHAPAMTRAVTFTSQLKF
jgi:hypothetical protein